MNTQWRISDDVADIKYNIEGNTLFFVDQVRDLSVHHDYRLKYDKHISLITHNAHKRAALILKCFHTRDQQTLKLALCTYVRPLLEFASQILSPGYSGATENAGVENAGVEIAAISTPYLKLFNSIVLKAPL